MIKSLTCILPPIPCLNRPKREEEDDLAFCRRPSGKPDPAGERESLQMPRDLPDWTAELSLRPGKSGDMESAPTPESRCPWKTCNKISCQIPWHKPTHFSQYGFLEKLKPLIFVVGVGEIFFGTLLVFFVVHFAVEFDRMYNQEESKMISFLSFAGLITLAVSGMVLVASILFDQRGMLWFYALLSAFLCIYFFVLSTIMIHYSLMILSKEPITDAERHSFFNKPSVIGMLTLLGSVLHFIGTVSVFTYYNLKYVHPDMFENNQFT